MIQKGQIDKRRADTIVKGGYPFNISQVLICE